MNDVTIKVTKQKTTIVKPLYADEWNEINQTEFSLDVEDVAWFYAREGNYIEVLPYEGFNQDELELYLNSTVYGAILQQRKMLPLHGSCFNYDDKNIMICGESGVGKSSLTVAFCLRGSKFITDDVSPIVFESGNPHVLALSDRIKLWDDTLSQLNINKEELFKIQEDTDKFYFPMKKEAAGLYLLNQVFILEIHDLPGVEFEMLKGVEKLTMLRNQVFRLEILHGMPDNEILFFHQLADISSKVTITRIKRPATISINLLMEALKKHLSY
jgi:hypothetical protein